MGFSVLESYGAGAEHKKLISAKKSAVDIRMMLGTSKQRVMQIVNKLRLQLIEKPSYLSITFYIIKKIPSMQRSCSV